MALAPALAPPKFPGSMAPALVPAPQPWYPLWVRHKQDQEFILLQPQAAVLPDQMLAALMLTQHQVLSSKTVKPHAPCGPQCMGHTIRMRSVFYSETLHMQFSKGARLHLCMDEWNCATPFCRQLSLTQTVQSKLIPTGLTLVLGMKTQSLDVFSKYSTFYL